MYCKMCGKQTEDERDICQECEANLNTKTADGSEIKEVIQENNNNSSSTNTNVDMNAKSKIAAGLFGIFLGAFGVHNFYLGFTGKAVAQLLITVLTCGFGAPITSIWGLIEGILILSGDAYCDAEGRPLRN